MIDWVVENWTNIFSVIGIIGTSCTAVVKVFSGCKWASALVKLCDYASVVNTASNKAILEKYTKKK